MTSQESSHAAPDGNSTPTKTTPKDALVMASILREMGVTEFEPRILNQMVEFAYRYVTDTVEDARSYAAHANRKALNLDDIKLAVSQKLDHSFTSPPPREFLLDIARSKNALPLPLISDRSGIRLPPERYCLTSNNYKVKSTTKKNQPRKQSTTASSKANTKTAANPLNVNAQKIINPPHQFNQFMAHQHEQQPQQLLNANSTSVRPQSTSVPQIYQGQSPAFPSMLKRKHEGDDDYDT